jgi:hypothetical protein
MKKFAMGLYLAAIILFLIAALFAEIFIVTPWGWAYLWDAARHLWATPFAALTLRDFGLLLFGACVILGSWWFLCVLSCALFEGFEERFPSEPTAKPSDRPLSRS